MFAGQSTEVSEQSPPRRTGWLTWLAAVLLLLFAFSYFVVKPLVEKAIQGAGGVVVGLMLAAAQAVQVPYDLACQRVQHSDDVARLVGEPIQCTPIEKAEWLEAGDRNELEFKFEFTGPKGTGSAHVVVAPSEASFEAMTIDVTGPSGDVTRLLVP